VRWYGENVGENIGNPLGTWKEHSANTLGSREKWKKIFPPRPPAPKHKRKKKQGTLSACLGLPIGCMKFLFPKDFVTILAWANAPCKEHPTYSVLGHIWFLKIIAQFFKHFRSSELFCKCFRIQAFQMTKLGW
jgi:hypothetical protein